MPPPCALSSCSPASPGVTRRVTRVTSRRACARSGRGTIPTCRSALAAHPSDCRLQQSGRRQRHACEARLTAAAVLPCSLLALPAVYTPPTFCRATPRRAGAWTSCGGWGTMWTRCVRQPAVRNASHAAYPRIRMHVAQMPDTFVALLTRQASQWRKQKGYF